MATGDVKYITEVHLTLHAEEAIDLYNAIEAFMDEHSDWPESYPTLDDIHEELPPPEDVYVGGDTQ